MRSSAELFAVILLSSIVLIYAGYILMQWNKLQNTMLNVNSWLENRMSFASVLVSCQCGDFSLNLSDAKVLALPKGSCVCYVYNSPDLEKYYSKGKLATLLLLDREGNVLGVIFLKGVYEGAYINLTSSSSVKPLVFGDLLQTQQVAVVFYKNDLELPVFCLFNITDTSTPGVKSLVVRACSG